MDRNVLIVLVIVGIIVAAGGYWLVKTQTSGTPQDGARTACTQEAKLCPDGSYVSRTGPECEFEACATADDQLRAANTDELDTSDWKTYRNEEYGFEFQYPKIYDDTEACRLREGDDAIGIGNRVGITIYDPKGLTLEEHVAERQKHLVSTSEEFPEVKKIFMGENNRIEALRLDYHTRGLGRVGIIVFLLHDGRPYEFSYFAGPSCNEDIHEAAVLLRILSTFKFTK